MTYKTFKEGRTRIVVSEALEALRIKKATQTLFELPTPEPSEPTTYSEPDTKIKLSGARSIYQPEYKGLARVGAIREATLSNGQWLHTQVSATTKTMNHIYLYKSGVIANRVTGIVASIKITGYETTRSRSGKTKRKHITYTITSLKEV